MKKILIVLVGGLLLSVAASASTMQLDCTGISSANGVGSFSLTQIFCPQFSGPVGNVLQSVEIDFEDGFVQGTAIRGQTDENQFKFAYTSLDPALGVPGNSYNEIVKGNGSPDFFTSDSITLPTGVTYGGGYYEIGSLITTGLGSWTGLGTDSIGYVQGSTIAGSLANTGQISFNGFVVYTYGLPEPMTMVLVGGGLLGLGLLAGKRRKKV